MPAEYLIAKIEVDLIHCDDEELEKCSACRRLDYKIKAYMLNGNPH